MSWWHRHSRAIRIVVRLDPLMRWMVSTAMLTVLQRNHHGSVLSASGLLIWHSSVSRTRTSVPARPHSYTTNSRWMIKVGHQDSIRISSPSARAKSLLRVYHGIERSNRRRGAARQCRRVMMRRKRWSVLLIRLPVRIRVWLGSGSRRWMDSKSWQGRGTGGRREFYSRRRKVNDC